MLSKAALSTNFESLVWPEIEPQSPRPLVNTLLISPMAWTRPSKTKVEKASVPMAVKHRSVGPKARVKVFLKGTGSVTKTKERNCACTMHKYSTCWFKKTCLTSKFFLVLFTLTYSESLAVKLISTLPLPENQWQDLTSLYMFVWTSY